MQIILILLFLVASSLHLGDDYVFFQWFVGIIFCLVPIHLWVKGKTSNIFALAFTLFSAYVAYTALASFSVYATIPQARRLGFSLAALMAYISVSIPMLSMLMVDKRFLTAVPDVIPIACLINSLYVIITAVFDIKFTNSMGYSGFIDYSGMNGVLIAVCATPSISVLFVDLKNKVHQVVVILAMIALYLSKGSISYGVLASGIVGIILTKQRGAKTLLKLLPLALVPMLIAVLSEGKDVLDSGRRFEAYQTFITAWWSEDIWTKLFGYGPSEFQIVSGVIQRKMNFMVNKDGSMWAWTWVHSEFIQSLIEYGILGLALILALLGETLLKLYKKNDKTVFAIACSLVGASIFDYPCRLFPTAVLVMWCLAYAYLIEDVT